MATASDTPTKDCTLARRWVAAGHEVIIGARDLKEEKLQALLSYSDSISACSIPDSIDGTDVIVVAIPAHHTTKLCLELGDLRGRPLIDTTNSVFRKPDSFANGFEALQKLTGADVIKCFNSTGAENMAYPYYQMEGSSDEVQADMFVAGNSARAKKIAIELAEDAGFVCYDFGGNPEVALLEELCAIWINLAMRQGLGRNIAFKLLRR